MPASTSTLRRSLRPLFWTATAGGVLGGGVIYYSYRPVNIPGTEAPAVPIRFAADGSIAPPRFPRTKSRDEHIMDLQRIGGAPAHGHHSGLLDQVRRLWNQITGSAPHLDVSPVDDTDAGAGFDLLVIGGGATGSGIALDAATRGLRVAMVERDDFSSGTSSKSTKLVHGGVRYLEKAVWELDYNQ